LSGWIRSLLKVSLIFFSLVAVLVVATYLTLIVLLPEETVVVPEVVGKEVEEAVLILSKNKLSARITGKKFSSKIPVNVVISQTPAPGTKVREGRSIKLVISGGAEIITAPDVVGMKLREAKVSLSEIGVDIANMSYTYSKVSQSEVIAQDPPAGFKVVQQEGINLLVSAGPFKPKLMMPDLRGKRLEGVASFLKESSIKIAMIKEEPSSEKEGIIIFQSPPPGSIVDENTRVELVISSREKESVFELPGQKWILIPVQIPFGLGKKRVSVVMIDKQGERELDYGVYSPGEKVWISCEVTGGGKVEVYVDEKLVKVKQVKG